MPQIDHSEEGDCCHQASNLDSPDIPPPPPSSSSAHPPAPSVHRLFVFYHYLYPDNVVSSIHITDLCQGLAERGWQVTAFPANRGCRDEHLTYSLRETHKGIHFKRLWRPRLRQASSLGRLLNAGWMIARWSLLALRPDPPSALIVGTDPILSVTIASVWKLLRPRTRILHWCFDLYPEAAYADGLLSPNGIAARFLEAILRRAYKACDAIIDIGPCMRSLLARYQSPARRETIVPWALAEPANVLPIAHLERQQIFGEAPLAMLYSGSFGRAHTYTDFLALAHHLAGANAMLAFSIRGNSEQELRSAVRSAQASSICTISFVPFAPENRLEDRLAAPDIHLLSLAPAWTGTVIPSKFFGALAAGRPVLYSGSPHSSIAQWIAEYNIGWLLTPENLQETAARLLAYTTDTQRIAAMQQRCLATYQQFFSKQASLSRMHSLLLQLVEQSREAPSIATR